MKHRFTLLFALLCASMMGWAYTSDPDTWIGSTDATYSNQFKWLVVEGMDTPNDVVNIQKPGFAAEIGIYMNFPDAAFNAVYMNGVLATNEIEYKQDGAGIVIYLSALSAKNTEIVIKQGETIRWGLNVYNAKGVGEGGEGSEGSGVGSGSESGVIDWNAYEWLGNGSGNAAYTDKIKVAAAEGQTVINLQQPDWAAEAGIYTHFGAGIQSCSLPEGKYQINGAGICLYLSAFTAKETEVTIVDATKTYVFTVYYEDGVAGEGGGEGTESEPTEIWDVNFALQSQGATATAKSGNNPGEANDGNEGSRWWSATGTDEAPMTEEEEHDQWWQVNLGQRRIFNTIQILWEGAWGKSFDIQISDDGAAWTTVKQIRDQNIAGPFPYLQTIELDEKKIAQYVRFQGIERGTGYAYSFWEFRVLLPNVSVLTTIDLKAGTNIAKIGGEGIALTTATKDQNSNPMSGIEITYVVTPADAGYVEGGKYIPAKIGEATIVAKSGEVVSNEIKLYGYTGENVALEKNVEASGYDETNNLFPSFAVDNNEGSLWSARTGETGDVRIYDAWIIVDLGAYYDLNLIALRWQGACSKAYHVDFSANKTDWRVAYNAGWNAIEDHWEYLCGTVDNTKVRYVRVWSTEAVSQYGVKIMDLKVFGEEWVPSSDTEKPVMGAASIENNTFTSAIINVSATDNTEIKAYHVVDATNGIDVQVVAIDGKITLNDLMDATTYNLTITAIDVANNESDNNAVVTFTTPFNAAANLALNKSCEAGYYDGNPAESADKVNDGNANTAWVTYADQPASKEWWYVDLGRNYQLNTIKTMWGDVYSTEYILQIRTTAPAEEEKADDTAWTTLATITDATANGEVTTSVAGVGRYVRIHSLSKSSNFFRLRELQVFGTSVVNDDTEKPVMSDASLISNDDSHAVISVSATDNNGVASYRVEDTENGINAILQVVDGKVMLEGLAGSTTYTITIKAIDFFGNESDNSKTVTFTTTLHLTAPTTAALVPTWPADQVKSLYSNTYPFAPASLNSYNEGWWAAPAMTEGNVDGNTYLYYTLANDGMIGWQYAETSVASMENLHIDIWASASGTISIRPITNGGPEIRKSLTLVAQQWNSFDIPMTDFAGHDWTKLFQFAIEYWNAGGLTGEFIGVDNVYFYRTTPIVDDVAPTNLTVNVNKESFYSIALDVQAEDNMAAVSFSIMNGTTEVATGAAASGATTTIMVNNLTPNTNYTFTVIAKDEAGNAAEPVSVIAKTLATPVAAPTPDFSGKNVLPIFTDAMAGGPATIHSGGWGETTIPEWLDLTENDKVFYAQKFNFAGWHSFGEIDATDMAYLHIDFYSIGMTQVSATPISPGHEGVATVTLNAGAWTSVDIPLSTYAAANIEWNNIFQFKFMDPVDDNELFVDNVYFWQPIATTTVDGWGTFASAGNVQVPTGVTAYKAAYSNNGGNEVLVLTKLEDGIIPAGEGVLIEGAASTTYGFTSTATTPATDMTDNDLIGTTTLTDVSAQRATSDIFCLRRTELFGTTAFCLYSGQYIPAGKAYLALPQINGQAGAPRNIRMVFNTATGIEDVQGTQVQSTKVIENGQLIIIRDGKRYNAQGARVQ